MVVATVDLVGEKSRAIYMCTYIHGCIAISTYKERYLGRFLYHMALGKNAGVVDFVHRLIISSCTRDRSWWADNEFVLDRAMVVAVKQERGSDTVSSISSQYTYDMYVHTCIV